MKVSRFGHANAICRSSRSPAEYASAGLMPIARGPACGWMGKSQAVTPNVCVEGPRQWRVAKRSGADTRSPRTHGWARCPPRFTRAPWLGRLTCTSQLIYSNLSANGLITLASNVQIAIVTPIFARVASGRALAAMIRAGIEVRS